MVGSFVQYLLLLYVFPVRFWYAGVVVAAVLVFVLGSWFSTR
jgi:hypothetical protein